MEEGTLWPLAFQIAAQLPQSPTDALNVLKIAGKLVRFAAEEMAAEREGQPYDPVIAFRGASEAASSS